MNKQMKWMYLSFFVIIFFSIFLLGIFLCVSQTKYIFFEISGLYEKSLAKAEVVGKINRTKGVDEQIFFRDLESNKIYSKSISMLFSGRVMKGSIVDYVPITEKYIVIQQYKVESLITIAIGFIISGLLFVVSVVFLRMIILPLSRYKC
jgi:hypothetical protein